MTDQQIKEMIKTDEFKAKVQAALDSDNIKLSEFSETQRARIIKIYAAKAI